jgi:hypothetical protein
MRLESPADALLCPAFKQPVAANHQSAANEDSNN